MSPLPTKLKKDAIAEAICELRFESDELPELVVGRLASNPDWKSFKKLRLPVSDIPEPVRSINPSLKFEPTLQLNAEPSNRLIKLGSCVISYHVLSPYCGWQTFYNELSSVISFIFSSLGNFICSRIGFRYINLLNSNDHNISSLEQLSCTIQIAGHNLKPPLNLNYLKTYGDHAQYCVMVKVASPEFISGNVQAPVAALIDVDVFTPANFQCQSSSATLEWITRAHEFEKKEFFNLIPDNIIKQLREK